MSRVGIVVISAIMVEIISVVQYQHIRRNMLSEMYLRNRFVMNAISDIIGHALEITETTMNENLWEVRRQLSHPDSVYTVIEHIIDDNPHVTGGCMAFVPDYYPSRGRLFEPYVSKRNGGFVKSQLAGLGHDYTTHEAWRRVMASGKPVWSDPYVYGPDSLKLTTYSFPITDSRGRLAAVCGLDMDLEWLGDTLNTNHRFPSSFRLLLTGQGELLAGPSPGRIPPQEVSTMMDIITGKIPASDYPEYVYEKESMKREPYWQVVQVYKKNEIYARIHRMRQQQMLFILLGLAILAFMINRYARSERKLRETSQEQARLGGELTIARNIQREMLPKTFPPYVYGSVEPAREVGGDLFDFFARDGKLFFCIGDVSGKGVPSAMLMSVAHSIFRMVSQNINSPAGILQVMNRELCRGNESNMFLTFFVGCLDKYTGELSFANAGHDKPFLISGEVSQLDTKANLPLGVFDNTSFEQQTCTLSHGTTLVLYTDGLTEAKNSDRKQFGAGRVKEVLDNCQRGNDRSPRALVSALTEAVHGFAGSEAQSDDLTLLVVNYYPQELVRDSITLENTIAEVDRLGPFVKNFCTEIDLGKSLVLKLRLALEEAVVNVINYAYPAGEKGTVNVMADSDRHEIRFTVIDSGSPFNPTTVMEADTTHDAQIRPVGGLGIHLVRELMDSMGYERKDKQNILTMIKKI